MKKNFHSCLLLAACLLAGVYLSAQVTGEEPKFTLTKTLGNTIKGSHLGVISFQGKAPGSSKIFTEGATIRATVTGNPASDFHPTSLYFSTGTNQLLDRMVITESGLFGFNTNQPNARLSLRHYYDLNMPTQTIFELEGGYTTAPRYFKIYNEVAGTIKAQLQGDLMISEGGSLTIAQGDAQLQKGHLDLKEGNATIAQGNLQLNHGRVQLTEGDVLVEQGIVDLKKGNLLVHEGKLILGNVPVQGDYSIFAEHGLITEKVKVALKSTADWSDYVLAADYELPTLKSVEQHICEQGHLPGIPSAEEVVRTGIDVAKMDAALLKKIEELTLYVIELQKQNERLQQQINQLNGK